jgi:ribosome-interacting GTPase 1
MLSDVREKNSEQLREMVSRGAMHHYLFVSSKTDDGLDELKKAIFDCNIDFGQGPV